MSGSLTLGDLKGRLAMLKVECGRCERAGRYRLDTLLRKHGADCKLPDLRRFLSHDCANSNAAEMDRCQVRFPDLAKLR